MSPEDGPFVFGAYAAHLDRVAEPVPVPPSVRGDQADPSVPSPASDSDKPIDKVAC